jgi:desulfoferrodoxin (superoxide reductase-like protein)
MARKLHHISWIALFLSSAILGCTRTAVQQKSVPDPMLVTKPAVEGRPHAAQASPIRRSEPTPTPPAPAE